MSRIFLSYRRQDQPHAAARIYDYLVDRFGAESVFKDLDSLPPGEDFRRVLEHALVRCEAALIVIGPSWLDLRMADGTRRLDQPTDFVRLEIERSLAREIPVIPVLLDGTAMPRPEQLPEALRDMCYRQAVELPPDPHFKRALDQLGDAMARVLKLNAATLAPTELAAPIDSPARTPAESDRHAGSGPLACKIVAPAQPSRPKRAKATRSSLEAPRSRSQIHPGPTLPAAAPPTGNAFERGLAAARGSRGARTTTKTTVAPEVVVLPASRLVSPIATRRSVPGFSWLRQESTLGIYMCDAFAYAGAKGPSAEFVLVPPGSFAMGGTRNADEKPVHTVTVESFLIARTTVTQRVWKALAKGTSLHADPSRSKGDDRPVERVSWDDATSWCGSNGLRLPSEAEWEYACRAGSTTEYGIALHDSKLGWYAWHRDNSDGASHPVAELLPNAFRLFDMHGNVWEWCQDAYVADYHAAPVDGSARSEAGSTDRVRRGGSWSGHGSLTRSACRSRLEASARHGNVGFRPCRSLG